MEVLHLLHILIHRKFYKVQTYCAVAMVFLLANGHGCSCYTKGITDGLTPVHASLFTNSRCRCCSCCLWLCHTSERGWMRTWRKQWPRRGRPGQHKQGLPLLACRTSHTDCISSSTAALADRTSRALTPASPPRSQPNSDMPLPGGAEEWTQFDLAKVSFICLLIEFELLEIYKI